MYEYEENYPNSEGATRMANKLTRKGAHKTRIINNNADPLASCTLKVWIKESKLDYDPRNNPPLNMGYGYKWRKV